MSHPKVGVEWFATEMLAKLNANSHKRGWEDIHIGYALRRLYEEAFELEDELQKPEDDVEAIISECADISNFAMMIAWKVATQRNPSK